jgi:hypothetical protein
MGGRRKIVLAGVVAVAVGVVSAAGLASSLASQRTHRARPEFSTISSALTAHFAVFRQTRRARAADAEPLPSIPMVSSMVARQELDTSDTAFFRVGSAQMWFMPGASGACEVLQTSTTPAVQTYGGGCETTQTVLQYGLVGFRRNSDGSTLVHGMVPDGNVSVSVTLAGGTQESVPVVSNTFAATFQASGLTISFRNANGTMVSLPYTTPVLPAGTR